MGLHTGLSTWFVRTGSAAGIPVEQLETARFADDDLQHYMQRVERRMMMASISMAGMALLICLATLLRA